VSISSTSDETRFRPLGRGTFVGGVLMTVALHVGLAAMVYFGHVRAAAPAPVVHDVMITRMVHLGKPREKFLLPKIPEPPPPKAPPPQIKVTDDLNAPAAKKEPPKPRDPEPAKQANHALDRARELARRAAAEQPPEGELNGSALGTATSAAEGDAYATAVHEAISRNWSVPAGLSVGEVSNYQTEIRVSIAPDGELVNPSIVHSSGNALFDDACMQAIQTTHRVPPPPAPVRARFRRGVALAFMGKELAR
jgi:TonB family protein